MKDLLEGQYTGEPVQVCWLPTQNEGLLMPYQSGMLTLEEIGNSSDEELKKLIDQQFANEIDTRGLLATQIYRDELVRREQNKATQAMLGYTEKMHIMTAQFTTGHFLPSK
jgi:hypothetical protein